MPDRRDDRSQRERKSNTIRLEAGTYTLTAFDNDNLAGDGANGLPSVTGPLTIRGRAAAATIIERAGTAPLFRLFHIAVTGSLQLEDLTVRGGSSASTAPFRGGGILNHGRLIMADCLLTENSVDHGAALPRLGGGGFFSDGVAVIERSSITLNVASGDGAGGGGVLNMEP